MVNDPYSSIYHYYDPFYNIIMNHPTIYDSDHRVTEVVGIDPGQTRRGVFNGGDFCLRVFYGVFCADGFFVAFGTWEGCEKIWENHGRSIDEWSFHCENHGIITIGHILYIYIYIHDGLTGKNHPREVDFPARSVWKAGKLH